MYNTVPYFKRDIVENYFFNDIIQTKLFYSEGHFN